MRRKDLPLLAEDVEDCRPSVAEPLIFQIFGNVSISESILHDIAAMDKIEFEARFRHHLKASDTTQSRLARALGVSRTTVNKWITTENRIPYAQLHAVCVQLGIDGEARRTFFGLAGYEQADHPSTAASADVDPAGVSRLSDPPPAPSRHAHDAFFYTQAGNARRPAKLIGRKMVGQRIHALLDQGKHVLLTGLGGTGKTALAAAVADERLAGGEQGVIWVGTRGEDAESILDAVAAALDDAEALVGTRGDAKIRATQQLLSAAPVQLAVLDDVWEPRIISQVRRAMPPELPLLMTSRWQSANVDAVVPIGPLSPNEAVALLAYHTAPGAPAVADPAHEDASPMARTLCAELGYHPLGIIIAGAWLKQHRRPPQDLLHRIAARSVTPFTIPIPESFAEGDRITVKVAFDQTYKALSTQTKALFRTFGYLAEPQASSSLLAALLDVDRWRVETWLDELVTWNLAQRSADWRYIVHDMVHDYARMLLPKHNTRQQQQIIAAMARYVRAHAQELDLLHFDLDNILQAAEQADDATRLSIITALALEGYVDNRGHSRRLLAVLDQALAYLTGQQERTPQIEIGRQLHHLLSKRGNAHFDRGEYAAAATVYTAARAAAYNHERKVMLTALIGKALSFDGKMEAAQSDFTLAEEQARAAGDDLLLSFVLEQAAHAAGQRRDFAAARRVAAEQVAINERLLRESDARNRHERLFRSLINLGTAEIRLAQQAASSGEAAAPGDVLAIHQRAAEIAKYLDSAELLAHAYWALGEDYHFLHDRAQAARFLGAAYDLYADLGKVRDREIVAVFMQQHDYPPDDLAGVQK